MAAWVGEFKCLVIGGSLCGSLLIGDKGVVNPAALTAEFDFKPTVPFAEDVEGGAAWERAHRFALFHAGVIAKKDSAFGDNGSSQNLDRALEAFAGTGRQDDGKLRYNKKCDKKGVFHIESSISFEF